MKTLKTLREEFRAFNFDTEEELDLDALADIDIESLLGDGYLDADEPSSYGELNFDDIENTVLDDEDFPLTDDGDDFDPDANMSMDDIGDDLALDTEVEGEDDELLDFDLNSAEDELDAEVTDFDDMSQNQAVDIALDDPEAAEENPDFQGEIRTVRGANLVYKRRADDGNFEELWIYNVGNDIKRETQIRRAILAGTDIDPSAQESKDGSQRADTTTTGNVQFLHITGLPQ